MRAFNHNLPTFFKWCGLRLVMVLILSLPFWTTVCFGANVLEEEKLDRAAGILDREWRINLIRLATRDYLRLRSQVKTGLPNYDQLVENTRLAPSELYKQLTARPVEPTSSVTRGASSRPDIVNSSPDNQQRPSVSTGGQQTPSSSQTPPAPPTNSSPPPSNPDVPLPDLSPQIPSLPPGAPTPTLPPSSGPGPSIIP